MASENKLYAERDIMSDELSPRFADHMDAMTGEGLNGKSEIAAELAYRDLLIAKLQDEVEFHRRQTAHVLTIPSKLKIREIFINSGFTIKEGQEDLKPYVYEAAYTLLKSAHRGMDTFGNGEVVPAGFIKPDNDDQIFYYEQDFYVLSSFSAFSILWKGIVFPTLEHAYHWEKFPRNQVAQKAILKSKSAHDAFQLAKAAEVDGYRRMDWLEVRESIMEELMYTKAHQHPYVLKKLLQSGTKTLIEDSWRDSYWGWGPDRAGNNIHGQCWMRVRERVRQEEIKLASESEVRT